MASFTIYLDKAQYTLGDQLQGRAELKVDKPTNIVGVRLTVKGYEYVSFTHTATVHNANHHHHHSGGSHSGTTTQVQTKSEEHKFINHTVTLWGSEKGGAAQSLNPGVYSYPFQLNFQHGMLPSYTSKLGKVAYKLTAWAEVPSMLKRNIKGVAFIPVTAGFDQAQLNSQQLSAPRSNESSKNPTLGSGKLSINLTIDKGWIFPGEQLPVTVTCDNSSSKTVRGFLVQLRLNESAMAHGASTRKQVVVAKAEVKENVPKGKPLVKAISLAIPSNLQPNIAGKLLKSDYEIFAEMDIKLSRDLNVKVPVSVIPNNPHQQQAPPSTTGGLPPPFSLPCASPPVVFSLGPQGAFNHAQPTGSGSSGAPPSTTAYQQPMGGAPPSTTGQSHHQQSHHDHHSHHQQQHQDHHGQGAYPPGVGGGAYPPGSGGGAYPPGSGGGAYPPGTGQGAYPPGTGGGAYPPGTGQGAYPPGVGGAYPPGVGGGAYPPGTGQGAYPPGTGSAYPQQQQQQPPQQSSGHHGHH